MRDAAAAGVLAAGFVAELLVRTPAVTAGQLALGLATILPLALRSRWPVPVGLGVQAVFAVTALVVVLPETLAQGISVFVIATYTAALGPRSWLGSRRCGLAAAALVGLQGLWDERYGAVGAVVANTSFAAMVWVVAAAVRLHADRSARSAECATEAVADAENQAKAAVAAERARVSRELHDVVAHGLSVVVVRARGGIHEQQSGRGDAALNALRDVEEVAARALADMRHLLALVADEDGPAAMEPQPSLDDVAELVRRINRAGVPARLEVRGEPARVTPGLELSAYRVVQESLTNVLRHSGGGAAKVLLDWRPGELQVEITDDGASAPQPGTKRGLAGLRDRVELFGGTFSAGPSRPRGFRVAATLPVVP